MRVSGQRKALSAKSSGDILKHFQHLPAAPYTLQSLPCRLFSPMPMQLLEFKPSPYLGWDSGLEERYVTAQPREVSAFAVFGSLAACAASRPHVLRAVLVLVPLTSLQPSSTHASRAFCLALLTFCSIRHTNFFRTIWEAHASIRAQVSRG